MTRAAECACGRVHITVEEEPLAVVTCHCEFCQKRTGSAFQVSAVFSEDANVAITGETKVYNGVESKVSVPPTETTSATTSVQRVVQRFFGLSKGAS